MWLLIKKNVYMLKCALSSFLYRNLKVLETHSINKIFFAFGHFLENTNNIINRYEHMKMTSRSYLGFESTASGTDFFRSVGFGLINE